MRYHPGKNRPHHARRPARRLPALLAVLAFVTASTVGAALPAAVDGEPLPSLAPMLERAVPAVVNISTRTEVRRELSPLLQDPFFRRFFDIPRERSRKRHSLGSGVVVDAAEGYILTNHHVIDRADEITVTLQDGRNLQAELVGHDPETDIAVVRVPPEGLTALPLADSDDLRVGDFVVAIGSPFGLGQTVTSGIVSAMGRSGLGIEGYEDFIQTDASINPGNSGGALVNLRGELVGINTAILAPGGGNVGIGFAIPANMAREIMAQLVEYGEVRRGYLGVTAQDLTPELATAFGLESRDGAVITEVATGSPGAEAGLRPGDVIVAVNGRRVSNSSDVRNTVGLARLGQEVAIEFLRDGAPMTVTMRSRAPEPEGTAGAQLHPRLADARFAEVDVGGDGRDAVRVGVLAVEQDGAAWNSGLRPGDIILAVNRQRVGGLKAMARELAGSGDTFSLTLQRGSRILRIVLR
ncbi:MAG: DegQ family serine endoprotease [Gammaproteobacteria bacterium]|nr:DegQ family serine endoprotease [Gammaproteobacteria bacterium]